MSGKESEGFNDSIGGSPHSIEDEVEPLPPTGSDKERLLWASEFNHLDVVKEILNNNKSLVNCEDDDGYTPLHRAGYKNNTNIIKELVLNGANLNKKTIDGWTPLHSACRWGKLEAASLFVSLGCDINSQTNSEQTPLHIAASHRTSCTDHLIQMLLMAPGIKYNLKNCSGDTPRDVAYRSGASPNLFEITERVLNSFSV